MKQLIIVIIAIAALGCQKEEIRATPPIARYITSPVADTWIHTATKFPGQSYYTFVSPPETIEITQTHVVGYGPYAYTNSELLLYIEAIEETVDIDYTIVGNSMTWVFIATGEVWKLSRA